MNVKIAGKFTADEIMRVHALVAEHFADSEDPISPAGVRSKNLLESAAARPFQSAGRKAAYGTMYQKAAVLFHGLIQNHPFHNGNKRTALIAAQVFLARENYWLNNITDDELFDLTKKTAAHEITKMRHDEVSYLADWFEKYTRKVKKGERPLTYRALKDILERLGFFIRAADDERYFDIYDSDNNFVTDILKRGIQGHPPYDSNYIDGLRKRLGLTSADGYDSTRFYNSGDKGFHEVASELIDLRIEVMQRLAKT